MTFYCWITLLTPASLDGLLAGIVRRGRGVEPLSSDGVLSESEPDDMGYFVAIEIKVISQETGDGDDPGEVIDAISSDIQAVIDDREIKHFGYSLVCKNLDGGNIVSTWSRGNIKVTSVPTTTPVPPAAWQRLGKS